MTSGKRKSVSAWINPWYIISSLEIEGLKSLYCLIMEISLLSQRLLGTSGTLFSIWIRWFKILLWCIWTFWKFDLSFRKFFILQTYSFLLKMATALPLSFFYYILVFKKDFQYIKFHFGQVLLKNFTTVLVWWKSRVSKPTFNKLLVQIRNY